MRLKYHDIKSDFNTRRMYYEKMGLGSSSSYRGSATQNRNMISWLKSHGYRVGTKSATKGIHLVNEEAKEIGISQGRLVDFSGGEPVFNGDMTSKLWDFAKDPTSFLQNLSPVMPKIANNSTSSSVDVGGINIVMNGVNDVETMGQQIRDTVSNDVRTQKFLKTFIYKDNNEYKKYR